MALELAKLWLRLRADTSKLPADLAKAHKQVSRSAGNLRAVFGRLAAVGGAIAGGATVGTMIKLAAEVEQVGVSFEVMLGSGNKAKAMIEDLKAFAAKTPFQFAGVAAATKQLLAFGVTQEEMMPTVRALGDISAGTGKDFRKLSVIFGQVKAKGRLMGQEIMQFAEAGVPVTQELAKQFGVTQKEILKMSENGKVSFRDFEKAMMSMTTEGGIFENMMQKQSQTVSGLATTLKDELSFALMDFGLAIQPITKAVLRFGISAVKAFNEWIEPTLVKLRAWSEDVSVWIEAFSRDWKNSWDLLMQGWIKTVLAAAKKVLDILGPIGDGVEAVLGTDVTTALDTATKAYDKAFKNLSDTAETIRVERAAEIAARADGPSPLKPADAALSSAFEGDKKKKGFGGRFGFREFGKKLQDNLIKKELEEQKKTNELLKVANQKQDELLTAVRSKGMANTPVMIS